MKINVIALFVCLIGLVQLTAQEEIPVIPADQIPQAVSIEDMEDRDMKTNFVKVGSTNTSVNVRTKAKVNAKALLPAKIYTGTLAEEETAVYFIQLAALYSSGGNINTFKRLGVFGNLYKQNSGSATKIKLGYFQDKMEASDILRQIKSMGYRDAFITQSQINAPDLELVLTGSHYIQDDYSSSNAGSSYTNTNVKYKVRLDSYQDAVWFSSAAVEDLGKIEQWTKGTWTIFVLSSYNSLEDAQRVKDIAVDRGFASAEVVLDNNGILEKVSY